MVFAYSTSENTLEFLFKLLPDLCQKDSTAKAAMAAVQCICVYYEILSLLGSWHVLAITENMLSSRR